MLMHVNIKVLSLKVSGNVWRHNADEQMLLKEKTSHGKTHQVFLFQAWATCACDIRTCGSEQKNKAKKH